MAKRPVGKQPFRTYISSLKIASPLLQCTENEARDVVLPWGYPHMRCGRVSKPIGVQCTDEYLEKRSNYSPCTFKGNYTISPAKLNFA